MTSSAADASHAVTIPLDEGLTLIAAAGTPATITADEITDLEQCILGELKDRGLLD